MFQIFCLEKLEVVALCQDVKTRPWGHFLLVMVRLTWELLAIFIVLQKMGRGVGVIKNQILYVVKKMVYGVVIHMLH
ncbi:hypothetical protein DN592_10340 [Raoultella ornithinolytica]|nr:hypothetical protein DN592_10340 [Raoultella ornithinolytica]